MPSIIAEWFLLPESPVRRESGGVVQGAET